jgi:ATP-binding cassette subfamily B protein
MKPSDQSVPSDWTTLRQLGVLLRPHSTAIALALASLSAASAGLLVVPLIVRDMLERASGPSPAPPSMWQILVMAGVLFGLAVAAYFSSVLLHEVARKVCAHLRLDYVSRWLRASMGSHRAVPPGESAERLNTCLHDMDWFIKSSLGNFLGLILLMSGGVFMLFWISWRLALVTALLSPLAVAALRLIERETRKLLRLGRTESEKMAGALQSVVLGLDVIKAFNAERHELDRFEARQAGLLRIQRKESFLAALAEPVLIATGAVTAMVVVFLAGRFIAEGTMTAAELVTFLVYLMFVLPNLRTLGLQLARWRHVKVALEFFEDASRLQPELDAPAARPAAGRPRGHLEFRGVSFAHEGRPRGLEEVSFVIRPGEQVGLVGPSGAGKSTIFQLLLRFYDPAGGSILLDGTDTRQSTRASVREAFSYVPQEAVLFDGSILDNLRLGCPGATDDEVRRACEAAQAWTFLRELPLGWDTAAGDRGLKLSAGQRQRLAIARALLRPAPVILLDEATSALDVRTEQLLGTSLHAALAGRTAIVIAHRLSTVASLPRLIFLHDGRIAGEGSHAELLDRSEAYRRMAGSLIGGAAQV